MGWRNWPSWLKGGMMLVIIFIILVLIQGIVFGKWTKDFASYSQFISIELLTQFPGDIALMSIPNYVECKYEPGVSIDINSCPNINLLNLLPYLSTLIIYFILGSIIGFVIGKIKNRGEK